ncbi:MAG: DUF2304 domain-containing protein [Xanthomonadales bacterium]|nr:DUF2304 domain-containing protein [Xanthomonadales bacterium]
MNIHWITALIGVALAGTILYLVRRDHLHGPFAIWWLLVAAAALILGAVPGVINWLGRVTHVYYPPILPITIGLSLVLVRLLKLDIDRSREERRLRRIVQKMALLEEELARLRGEDQPAVEQPQADIPLIKRRLPSNKA